MLACLEILLPTVLNLRVSKVCVPSQAGLGLLQARLKLVVEQIQNLGNQG